MRRAKAKGTGARTPKSKSPARTARTSRTQSTKPAAQTEKVTSKIKSASTRTRSTSTSKPRKPTTIVTKALEPVDIIMLSDDEDNSESMHLEAKARKPKVKPKKATRMAKTGSKTTKQSANAPKFQEAASEDVLVVSDDDDDDENHLHVSVGSFDKMFETLQAKMRKQLGASDTTASKIKTGKTSKKKSTTATKTVLELTSSSEDEGTTTKVKTNSVSERPKESNSSKGALCDDIDKLVSGFHTPPPPRTDSRSLTKRTGRGRGRPSKSKNWITVIDESDDDVQVVDDPVPNSKAWNLSNDSLQCTTPAIAPSSLPFTVRIRWKQELFKFKLCETDYCFEIRRLLAQELELNARELLIYFEDDPDKTFDDAKTLKDADVRLGTILEAERKIPDSSSADSVTVKQLKDPSLVRIKVQSSERRSEAYFEIRKTDPFRQLLFLFCQKMELPPSQVKFRFDGETVDLDDTPEGLDLEGDECFDVILS